MEFFKIRRTIPFMRHALVFNIISLITFLLAVFFLATKGLHYSVEFTGGTVIEVSYKEGADVDRIRGALEKAGYKDTAVQNFGSSRDVLIRMPLVQGQSSADLSQKVIATLQAENKEAELRRVEFVGPQVGRELAENGALALLIVSIGIVLYLALRFEWKFGLSAIIANLHDVVIILGFFALFQWEFSLPVLAAVLAVLGYSVNESVVVFDRVRENFRKMRGVSTPDVLNRRHHRHHLAHHHHARQHADHGHHHADLRRPGAALLCAGADHRHLLRHLLFGAGRQPAADVAQGRPFAVREGQEGPQRRRKRRRGCLTPSGSKTTEGKSRMGEPYGSPMPPPRPETDQANALRPALSISRPSSGIRRRPTPSVSAPGSRSRRSRCATRASALSTATPP